MKATVSGYRVTDGVLHPRVRGRDKGARSPCSQPHHEGREPVYLLPEDVFTKQEEPAEGRFEKEGEGAFHCQSLRDNIAWQGREACPGGAELELHGDTLHDAHDKGDGEDSGQETGTYVI